jgi:glycosyltransferase involved in cell wall biosynthesis
MPTTLQAASSAAPNAQRIKVVLVSKALVVGAYQRKAVALAQLGIDLTVLIPPAWNDRRGSQCAERMYTAGYTLRVIPLRLNGNFHLHYYPTLDKELAALRPDLLHMDEEPYNLATWLALRAAKRLGVPATFFTWQNIQRRYPPPFAAMERANYRRARIAIAGNQDAAQVLRAKGYSGSIAVIPQFGVDPDIFCPNPAAGASDPSGSPVRIGYAGGLVSEKGVDLLVRACAGLQADWRLALAGEGEQQQDLAALAAALGVSERIEWIGRQASSAMPDFYRALDVLVLPSRTRPNWKEQFGRVLIEAMACAVPVIGSNSGEIPNVIGHAGLIFAEDNVAALCAGLQRLADAPAERIRLGQLGRQRVLATYTMHQIAEQTLAVYHNLLRQD